MFGKSEEIDQSILMSSYPLFLRSRKTIHIYIRNSFFINFFFFFFQNLKGLINLFVCQVIQCFPRSH